MARFIAIVILLSMSTISPIAEASQQKITDKLILEKNQQMASLLKARDAYKTISFLHSHISEDATFQISFQNTSMPAEHQKNSMLMDKEAYINSFIQGLHYVDKYDIDIETADIEITEDGESATAKEVIVEEGVMLNPQDPLETGIPFLSTTTCHISYGLKDGLVQSEKARCHTESGEVNTI